MKKNLSRIFFYLLIFFIISVFFIGLKKNNIYDTRQLINQKINSFELSSFDENIKISNNDLLENNYTLINFWASWCLPCRQEHKNLMMLKKIHDLKILGINFKDEKRYAKKFLKELGNPYYLIALDVDGKSSVSFGIYGITESILINKELKVIKKYIGPINPENILEIINEIK